MSSISMQSIQKFLNQWGEDILSTVKKNLIFHSGYKVTAEDVAAACAEFATGLNSVNGHMIQIYRAGNIVTGDAVVSVGKNGILIVESGAKHYEMAKGDIIAWLAW